MDAELLEICLTDRMEYVRMNAIAQGGLSAAQQERALTDERDLVRMRAVECLFASMTEAQIERALTDRFDTVRLVAVKALPLTAMQKERALDDQFYPIRRHVVSQGKLSDAQRNHALKDSSGLVRAEAVKHGPLTASQQAAALNGCPWEIELVVKSCELTLAQMSRVARDWRGHIKENCEIHILHYKSILRGHPSIVWLLDTHNPIYVLQQKQVRATAPAAQVAIAQKKGGGVSMFVCFLVGGD